MPQPGLHPVLNTVRVVMANGATYRTKMAWQSPSPAATVTRFLDVDMTTHELWTGKKTAAPRVGRAASFHKRFGAVGETPPGGAGAAGTPTDAAAGAPAAGAPVAGEPASGAPAAGKQ